MLGLRLWLLALCLLAITALTAAKEARAPSLFVRFLERFELGGQSGVVDNGRVVEEVPPRPLQVFEYGARTRAEFKRNKAKYKYQHVCLMDGEGAGVWHTRRTPWFWRGNKPPFHVRIVRPNFVGMLYFLMSNEKVRVDWVDEEVEMPDGTKKKCLKHKIVPL
eukprot:TRINITY_DN3125_c0_g1_i1.p3 TRINITY_DN3125_c0_g1~~TRINITY_DN3125_c0_g1_i1.p3  ORF type:complete len:163 (+),score=64.26 TRINITY_DN3125_c0_g1_i1:828-1316(+)